MDILKNYYKKTDGFTKQILFCIFILNIEIWGKIFVIWTILYQFVG